MRIKTIIIIFLLFTFSLISCAQKSQKQNNIKINTNELGLVFCKNDRYVLDSGEYRTDKESKVLKFNKIDSLITPEFDILDLNVKSLYCKVQIKYSMTAQHLENIAGLIKRIYRIEAYKKVLLIPEIRRITENYESEELKKEDYKNKAEVEKMIARRLNKYINLLSLELKIYEK